MNFSRLKKVRVFLSGSFFLLLILTFFNFYKILNEKAIEYIISLQFFPLIINQIKQFDYKFIIVIVIFALTFLFGRVYCSSICPLGTLQDIIIFISRKYHKKKFYFKFNRKISSVRNSVLIISLFLLVISKVFLVSILEPFSNFGRIINVIAIPLYDYLVNAVVFILTKINIYSISYIQIFEKNWLLIIFTFSFLIFLIIITSLKGRWFCNYLCPVGSFFSLIARFTFFKIKIDENSCTHCRKCEKVCKAECIDSKLLKIDFSSCICCYNCFDACPTSGIAFNNISLKKKKKEIISKSRRDFIKSIPVKSIILAPLFLPYSEKKDEYSESKKQPVTPPGSKSLVNFNSQCTACYLCVSACPTRVLVPTFSDYGIDGLLQPKMDFTNTFCNYDCNICSLVCPTDAISPVSVDEKKLIQIGKAKFVKEDCIVETKKTDCGACGEHCPTKAVNMVPYEKNLRIPELNNEICIGCGACEKPCPTKPRKAIFVVSNSIHQKAKKPEKKKLEEGFDSTKEFPF